MVTIQATVYLLCKSVSSKTSSRWKIVSGIHDTLIIIVICSGTLSKLSLPTKTGSLGQVDQPQYGTSWLTLLMYALITNDISQARVKPIKKHHFVSYSAHQLALYYMN
jgi:hypothetical protein